MWRKGPVDGDWVCQRIREAWSARPRTVDDTTVMAWPNLHLSTESDKLRAHRLNDMRVALHMMGLNASAPSTYPLHILVRHRLGWSWSKFHRLRRKACNLIAAELNANRTAE